MLRPPILSLRRAASALRSSTYSSLKLHHIMNPAGARRTQRAVGFAERGAARFNAAHLASTNAQDSKHLSSG
jgi:hypothetical protein